MVLKRKGQSVLLFQSYEEFEKQTGEKQMSRTAIVDYHFENSELSGAEILPRLRGKGFERLYLCTAEYWKPSLKRLAVELGVELISKPLPRMVVESVTGEVEGYTVLVIDDEPMIGITWKALRKNLNIRQLHFFVSLEKFIESRLDPSVFDVAFIDKNIEGSQYDGAAVVNFLKEKNIRRVVLASGENPDEVKKDTRFAKADCFTREKIPRTLANFLSDASAP